MRLGGVLYLLVTSGSGPWPKTGIQRGVHPCQPSLILVYQHCKHMVQNDLLWSLISEMRAINIRKTLKVLKKLVLNMNMNNIFHRKNSHPCWTDYTPTLSKILDPPLDHMVRLTQGQRGLDHMLRLSEARQRECTGHATGQDPGHTNTTLTL